MKGERTVVIGLDGAHFELIESWLESGELPNLEECIDEGSSGDMEVCLPPVTSPNWKCYSTGKNPGKLGIFWWENIDKEEKDVHYPNERKNKEKEIWDYLGMSGEKVCVIGTPLTYPPKEVNGVMISGGADAQEEGYTYPEEMEQELEDKYDYRVHPEHSMNFSKKKAVEEMLDLIDLRFEVGEEYIERDGYDFIQITTFYSNMIQHFLWRSEETLKAWKIIDNHIGNIMETDNTNIIIISDHGSNEIETGFNINSWLEREGYLKYNKKYSLLKFLGKIGLNTSNLGSILSILGLRKMAKKVVPENLLKSVPTKTGEIRMEGKTDKIDWEESDAIASGQGPLYILNEGKKEELKKKLERLKDPNGNRVLRNVFGKEEIYSGEYMDEAPDLILDQEKGVHIFGGIGKGDVFSFEERWKAENKKYGMFIGYGPDFKKTKVDGLSILDLTPTILSLHNIKPPEDMDGKIMKGVIEDFQQPSKELKDYNTNNTETKANDKLVKERLKDLGYME